MKQVFIIIIIIVHIVHKVDAKGPFKGFCTWWRYSLWEVYIHVCVCYKLLSDARLQDGGPGPATCFEWW